MNDTAKDFDGISNTAGEQFFCNEFQKRFSRRLSEISSFPSGLVAKSVLTQAMTDVLFGHVTTEVVKTPLNRAERSAPSITMTRHVGMLEDPDEVAKEMLQYHTCGTCKHLEEAFSADEAHAKQDFYICAAAVITPQPQAMHCLVLRLSQSGHWYVDCGPGKDPEYVDDCPAYMPKDAK